jgi:NADP-dependent 3-hydroxy acid dehydrogenase YdfG
MTVPPYVPKIVFVTGATGDIGRAIVMRFAALGCKLIVHGRDQKKVDALINDLKIPAYGVVFDLADTAAIEKSIAAIPAEFSQVDLLVNNAGAAKGLDKAHEALLEDWDNMIETNVRSLVRITRLILPRMVAAKRGHVVNIGSIAGTYQYPVGNIYGATKAFVKQFSLNIRADLKGTRVRVTNVEPGLVETQFSLSRFKGDKKRADAVYANTTPLVPDDIAATVEFVATQPEHVNVNSIEVMPVMQSFGPLDVERTA